MFRFELLKLHRLTDMVVGFQVSEPALDVGRVHDRNMTVLVRICDSYIEDKRNRNTCQVPLDIGRVHDRYLAVAVHIPEDGGRLTGKSGYQEHMVLRGIAPDFGFLTVDGAGSV